MLLGEYKSTMSSRSIDIVDWGQGLKSCADRCSLSKQLGRQVIFTYRYLWALSRGDVKTVRLPS
jgi:hypothetical protein